jgi:hypothetical protein
LALAVPLSRFTPRVGGGSAFYVRPLAHAMKKLITIGFTIGLLVVVTLLAWRHVRPLRDAEMFGKLPGTWFLSYGSLDVHPDGSYVLQFTHSPTDGILTNEGTFQVRDGLLINTVTKSYRTNAQLPQITRMRIIQMNDREMIIDNGSKSGLIFRKDGT